MIASVAGKEIEEGGLGYFLMTCLYYIMTFDPSYKTKHGWMIKINICIFPSFNCVCLRKSQRQVLEWLDHAVL